MTAGAFVFGGLDVGCGMGGDFSFDKTGLMR